MEDLYIGLGSNLGNREVLLRRAAKILEERIGGHCRLSAFYETEPWGFRSENKFLNAVAVLRSDKEPGELLRITQTVERELGRQRKSVDGTYNDRPIDIDLLAYGNRVIETDLPSGTPDGGTVHLSLPHPLMHRRAFVMEPLAEVAPEAVHPILKKTFTAIWRELQAQGRGPGNIS